MRTVGSSLTDAVKGVLAAGVPACRVAIQRRAGDLAAIALSGHVVGASDGSPRDRLRACADEIMRGSVFEPLGRDDPSRLGTRYVAQRIGIGDPDGLQSAADLGGPDQRGRRDEVVALIVVLLPGQYATQQQVVDTPAAGWSSARASPSAYARPTAGAAPS